MKRLMVLSSIAVLALSAFASLAQAKPLEAVASFTVIADMVSTVGGDRVHVKSLIGPNGDPHVYEPTPGDAQALKNADLAFVSGLHLEGWMDRLIKASGYKGQPVVLSEGIKTRSMDEDGKRIVDPHAWNSAANGVVYVRNIIAALKKLIHKGPVNIKPMANVTFLNCSNWISTPAIRSIRFLRPTARFSPLMTRSVISAMPTV